VIVRSAMAAFVLLTHASNKHAITVRPMRANAASKGAFSERGAKTG
jgi:hypothetical protein